MMRFQARSPQPDRVLAELLAEQKRADRLLQALVYLALGFLLGLMLTQFLFRMRRFLSRHQWAVYRCGGRRKAPTTSG